jgi:hypothetical protein
LEVLKKKLRQNGGKLILYKKLSMIGQGKGGKGVKGKGKVASKRTITRRQAKTSV